MKVQEAEVRLREVLAGELPGLKGQVGMSPPHRTRPYPEFQGIPPVSSAVLLLVYPKEARFHLVFMLRNVYKGPHSGQISFPGGKWEKGDADLIHTALRETSEEIGIATGEIRVCGRLTDLLVPITNFLITPIVGFCPHTPVFSPDPSEVRELLEIPVAHLLDPGNRKTGPVPVPWGNATVPYFDAGSHRIWGATAMILNEFLGVTWDLFAD
jgi:8-oxo-dGTP pyrophosphatase MutT (NUDIX family)